MANKIHTSKSKGIFQFFLGIIVCVMFIFIITPYFTDALLKSQYEMIKEQDIDCNALFYTESERAIEATRKIQVNQ